MQSMKKSLDNYDIVNSRMMRAIMKRKSSLLNNCVISEIILFPILSLFFGWACIEFNMNFMIAVTMSFALFVSIIIDWKTIRISPSDISSLSFKELKIKLKKQKRQRFWQFAIEIPIMLAWQAWFCYEFFKPDGVEGLGDLGSMFTVSNTICILLIILFSVAPIMIIYKYMQRVNDQLINEIHDSENEDEDLETEVEKR